jgi:hypothetical protein
MIGIKLFIVRIAKARCVNVIKTEGTKKTMKCQCCKNEEATWAWQPFGLGETTVFTLPGNHHRGFPVIKVCDKCKVAFQSGRSEVTFTYKKVRYVGKDHKVEQKIYPDFESAQEALDRGERVRIAVEPFNIDPKLLQLAQKFQDKERLEEWKRSQR